MDSKLLVKAMLIVTLLFATVFVVILYSNGYIGSKRTHAQTQTAKEEEEFEVTESDGKIKGSDLSAWMYDETFFDAKLIGGGKYQKSVEEADSTSLVLSASSVEKDLRIKITDATGEPVKGQLFAVMVGDSSQYLDDDRDGFIYIKDLKPGDYTVKLAAMQGFDIPTEPITCSVRAKIEYKAIADISYLIKTEADIDASREDTAVNDAAEETSGSSAIRTDADAHFGIDVSKYNGNIDWARVKDAGVEYAIIRCGYRGSSSGSIVVDPMFTANIEGATAAGIPVGVYFFTQALNPMEAVEEASAALSLVSQYKLDYPIFIDSEGAGGRGRADNLTVEDRSAVIEAFCTTIRSGGHKAGVYASRNWYNKKLDITKFSAGNVIWLAEYGDAPTYGGTYHLWQYSSAGRIDGIEGRVDMNLSFLSQ
ncbi:MAG: hypothetical protein K6E68_03165 [Lachnospiraceae bacterium]|nr:hypothetical protein [Lachnospiraceae bacterium]